MATHAFANYLIEQRLVSPADAERAQKHAVSNDIGLVEALQVLSILDSRSLVRALSESTGIPRVGDQEWPKSLAFAGPLSYQYLRQHRILPLRLEGDVLTVALTDPTHAGAIDGLRLATGYHIAAKLAGAEDITSAIERILGGSLQEQATPIDTASSASDDVEQLKDLALGAPVVRLVNQILTDALHLRATDIHVEPTRARLIVRYRIDGMLREVRSPTPDVARAVVSRIKILAGLDIAERRLPQDGRARLRVDGRQIDLRVATTPTINGEAIAIRLLENAKHNLELDQLGFSAKGSATLRRHLSAPYGLILVTGPTGSGKTTTLATALTILNEPTRKVLTVEDPVEYQIDGINQIQVKPEIGVTFAHTLRSFLRHDPDVIMVGELRDGETVRIAVQAALTGHLVLSTLHTNSAPGAVTRLLDMGSEAYLLASCLRCVIGQRLVRRLCETCRSRTTAPLNLPADILAAAGIGPKQNVEHWQAVGCDRCFSTGFIGRTCIIEIFELDDDISRLVKPGITLAEMTDAALRRGMQSMAADGIAKCIAGITTPDEVRRVALEA